MFKKYISILLILTILMSGNLTVNANEVLTPTDIVIEETDKVLCLWYDEEAPYTNDGVAENPGSNEDDGWERWSLPLGNGYFGANVFGRTATERIQLTEKTLANPYTTTIEGYGSKSLGGLNNFSETYIDLGHPFSEVENYERELDLKTAVSSVKYDYNGVTYSREYFVSYPDKVMVVKLDASQTGMIDFTLRPTIPFEQDYAVAAGDGASKHGTVVASEDGSITLSGHMGYYAIDFEGQYKVIPTNGEMTYKNGVDENGAPDNGTITVTGADSAYIVISIGTNYELGPKIFLESDRLKKLSYSTISAHDKVSGYMNSALAYNYNELKERHIADYSELFSRVTLDLGTEVPEITTDELLNTYKNGTYNTYLEELYFQYGRYLLIASSREGSLPANLQGVWNRYNFSPWSAGFWHNINVQMNYWPAFNTNIAETFKAYVGFNKAYMPNTIETARIIVKSNYRQNYITAQNITADNIDTITIDDANGWGVGTGANPYSVAAGRSPGNLGFTTKLFWDYYDFTRDEELLEKTVYPVISSGARFITKIVEQDEDGHYLTSYSTSPEQSIDGVSSSWYYTKGVAYDQMFAYENNNDTKKAAEILGVADDDTTLKAINEQIDLYDPVQIGYSGQVKEFREENFYGDIGEYNHRHISQLVGLYPGTLINETTPAWLDGAIVTLTERGDKATGWGMAHRLNLWARTKRGNRTYSVLNALLKSGTATNLWDLHPPFQIDGNLGGTAGIAEMLLQSHEGYIAPLPAIPDAWENGSYTGLVARGNFEVSAAWENKNAKTFNIKSNAGGNCRIGYFDIKNAKVKTASGEEINFSIENNDLISFETTKGETYIIYNLSEKEYIVPASEIKAEQISKNDFKITWSKSNDAVSYNVYKAVENDSDYTFIGTTTDTNYLYQTSANEENKRMTYRVCVVSESGRESEGVLTYVNPVNMEIEAIEAIQIATGVLQVAIQDKGEATGYKLYSKPVGGEYNLIQESKYPVLITDNYDESLIYGVSLIDSYFETGITKIEEIFSSDNQSEEDLPKEYENFLSGKTFEKVSGSGFLTGYGLEKLTDGDYNVKTGRFAGNDEANATITISCELDGVYDLGEITIYDHVESSETHTRCDQTTVEVFHDDTWTTVIDKQPLEYTGNKRNGDDDTIFDLTGNKASKIRLTFSNTSGESKGISLYEIKCSGTKISNIVLSEAPTNILKNISSDALTFTGRSKPTGTYAATNAFDENTSTRWAVNDEMSEFSVTIDLPNTYNVKTMKIYDFRNKSSDTIDGVLTTRSDKTSVEVYSNGVWTKVIDDVPMTVEDPFTQFDLGFAEASKLRITFNNTKFAASASIYEITCTAQQLKYADRRELLKVVEAIDKTDYSQFGTLAQTAVEKTLSDAIATLKSVPVGQEQVDKAIKDLNSIDEIIKNGDSDVLLEETDLYNGTETLKLYTVKDDIKWENGASGVGGKLESDKVYKLTGTPLSSEGGANYNYFGIQNNDGVAQNYTLEFSFMLANENSGILHNLSFIDSENAIIGGTFMNISKDGFEILSAKNIVNADSRGIIAPLNIGQWYKVAIVANCKDDANDTILVYINGDKHEIKLDTKPSAFRLSRIVMMYATQPSEIYYDNVIHKFEDVVTYNPNRDKLNILSSNNPAITVNGQLIDVAGNEITISQLKEAVGEDIRIYEDNTCKTLLEDSAYLTDDSYVVAYAKNLRDYERTYNYYTVVNAPAVNSESIVSASAGYTSGKVSGIAEFTNYSGKLLDFGKVIVAAFKEKEMVGFGVYTITNVSNKAKEEVPFEITGLTEKPDEIKVFVWKDFNTIKPLCMTKAQ